MFREAGPIFIVMWVVSALLSLALTGTIIWAIIRLILHFTS